MNIFHYPAFMAYWCVWDSTHGRNDFSLHLEPFGHRGREWIGRDYQSMSPSEKLFPPPLQVCWDERLLKITFRWQTPVLRLTWLAIGWNKDTFCSMTSKSNTLINKRILVCIHRAGTCFLGKRGSILSIVMACGARCLYASSIPWLAVFSANYVSVGPSHWSFRCILPAACRINLQSMFLELIPPPPRYNCQQLHVRGSTVYCIYICRGRDSRTG